MTKVIDFVFGKHRSYNEIARSGSTHATAGVTTQVRRVVC